MGIHFVAGRPGAGKGVYCMGQIEDELRFTNRPILTNLPVLRDVFGEYLNDTWGQSFDLLHRLRLLDDDEIRDFYRWRGGSLPKLDVVMDKQGRPETYDISGAQPGGGVLYVLDEVHLSFSARDWQQMGKAVMFYASQHRKLGDDVLLVTQAPKNVDAQFRSLAQDYTVLRNLSKEKFGPIKLPSVFTKSVYLNLPNGNEVAMEHTAFKLNKRLADCFDTSKGVGIQNRGVADLGKDKRKGFPWWVLVFLIIAGCFALYLVPKFFIGKFKKSAVSITTVKTNELKAAVSPPASVQTNAPPFNLVPTNSLPEPKNTNLERKVISYFRSPTSKGFVFMLDNGEEVSDRRFNLKKIISNEYIEDSSGNRHRLPGTFVLD